MKDQRAPIILKIIPYLSLIEKIFLLALGIGLLLNYYDANGQIIVRVSLLVLAITYFLNAFKLIDIPEKEGGRFDFKDLLAWSIAPKVLWISCGVSLFGLFIYFLQLEHDKHKQLLMICGLTIVIGLLVIGYAFITGTKHIRYVMPALIRAVPLLIADFYFYS